MKGHALRKPEGNIQRFVKPGRKKSKKSVTRNGKSIHIIGPVNQHARPDHDHQHREVYPMRPPDGKRMFFFNCLHFSRMVLVCAYYLNALPVDDIIRRYDGEP